MKKSVIMMFTALRAQVAEMVAMEESEGLGVVREKLFCTS